MRGKADSDLVRRQNRMLVLETLRFHGPSARVDIGRLTGLSPATITTITLQLLQEGAIVERADLAATAGEGRRGRPVVSLGLNAEAAFLIAIKISIGTLEYALADYAGQIRARANVTVPTRRLSAQDFSKRLVFETQKFVRDNVITRNQLAQINVAAQGVTDNVNGAVGWSPAFRVSGVAITGPLADAFGVPCTLANDANMIAEGLIARKAVATHGTTACVFMGYGIGMGLVIDGAVYHGTSGSSGEFGHMNHIPSGALCRCGRRGCLEAYASDYGILRSAENLPDDTPCPTHAVEPEVMIALENAARRGDQNAVAAFKTAGAAIGLGLARMIALLNPDRIVLSGAGTRALDLIEPAIREAIELSVAEPLRQNLVIETLPIDRDMIIDGTIDAALRQMDAGLYATTQAMAAE
ncbi:MAG: ROK family protein [Alphaproteobacteria bacterium]|nr:ROK family protein [Alphaproteobacteria bacterium]